MRRCDLCALRAASSRDGPRDCAAHAFSNPTGYGGRFREENATSPLMLKKAEVTSYRSFAYCIQ